MRQCVPPSAIAETVRYTADSRRQGRNDEISLPSSEGQVVTDTGCGMDETTQSRMFEHSFTTKSDGHGLGLASISRIVDGFGGLIQVRSQLGYGRQIRVLFPQG
jgi:signal transduction histidine kinase